MKEEGGAGAGGGGSDIWFHCAISGGSGAVRDATGGKSSYMPEKDGGKLAL